MYIVVVNSHIKAEHVERFREVTVRNAEASRGEEGCVRFDVLQQTDDPTRFTGSRVTSKNGSRRLSR